MDSKKKRLFLSAKGWQPGGALPDNATLLTFYNDSSAYSHGQEALPAEELPASLLRGGWLQLAAFSPGRSQASGHTTELL